MPGYNCSIKERMLYSSCKASLIDRLESQLGLEITKKVCVQWIPLVRSGPWIRVIFGFTYLILNIILRSLSNHSLSKDVFFIEIQVRRH